MHVTAPVTCIPDDNDDGQTELLTLQEDSGAKIKFETESLTVFWSSMAVCKGKRGAILSPGLSRIKRSTGSANICQGGNKH